MKKLAVLFFVIFGLQLSVVGLAMAQNQEDECKTCSRGKSSAASSLAIGAALAIGLAAAGGAIGQGRAAASAVEGIARNPGAAGKVQTPMIIGLALIESLVIYALVIAFMLQGKIDAVLGL